MSKPKSFSESEEKHIREKSDVLMDIGISYCNLSEYFDCVTQDQIYNLGIRSKRDVVLTPVQRRFCLEFVKDSNPYKAMDRLRLDKALEGMDGYCSHGIHFLDMEKVQKKIKQLMERAELDAEYILLGVKDTIERCAQARPVVDKKGEPILIESPDGESIVPAYTFDASNRLKGLEMLGKNLTLWTDNIKHSNDPTMPFGNDSKKELKEMSDDELQAIIDSRGSIGTAE